MVEMFLCSVIAIQNLFVSSASTFVTFYPSKFSNLFYTRASRFHLVKWNQRSTFQNNSIFRIYEYTNIFNQHLSNEYIYICKSNKTGRWPEDQCDDDTTRWHGPLATLDPEDIALICKSERYGFCIESSDRIPNGYDASFRYDAILFVSLSLSLCVWLARFRARWNLEWRHATFNP